LYDIAAVARARREAVRVADMLIEMFNADQEEGSFIKKQLVGSASIRENSIYLLWRHGIA
jgi:hypothetical protein